MKEPLNRNLIVLRLLRLETENEQQSQEKHINEMEF